MKAPERYLLILAFLLGLFTISFASLACVTLPENIKPYAVFVQGDRSTTYDCSFNGKVYVCCGEVKSGDLSVYATTTDNHALNFKYRVITSEKGDVAVTKVFQKLEAFITVAGKDGTYYIEENIPKSFVENASDIIFDGFVVENDPVIAWFVEVNNGKAVVHYKLRRGSVPEILPSVKLASCDVDYGILRKELLRGERGEFVVVDVAVLYNRERVLPTRISVRFGGEKVDYRVDPEKKIIEVFVPNEEKDLTFTVWMGDCRKEFTVNPYIKSDSFWWWLTPVAVIVAVVIAYRLLKG